MKLGVIGVGALLAVAAPLAAQDAASLARGLEGRTVVVLVDMPGDASGVEVWPDSAPPVDYNKLGGNIGRYGVAIPRGSSAMITRARVRKKEIEIHLGGGGYSGSTGGPYMSTTVRKSQQEKQLETELKVVTDPIRKREVRDQLRYEQDVRRREETRLKAEAEQARILREAEERELRLRAGSRFNIRWRDAVPGSAVSVEAVLAALDGLMQLEGAAAPATSSIRAPQPAPAAQQAANPMALRKGMSESDVTALFGAAAERREEAAAGLTVVSSRYNFEGGMLTAKFADGALVSWTMESR